MPSSLHARLKALAGRRVDPTSRRDFLAASLALGAASLLSSRSLFAQDKKPSGKRVVVVGGGFAGLTCAHELRAGGFDVTVVEARDEVGGRVRSSDKIFPGRTVEVGGELIGTNHPIWQKYAKDFELELIELSEDTALEQPVVLDKKRLTKEDAKKLLEEMDEAFKKLDEDAGTVLEDEPWKTPKAEALDNRSTADWLKKLEASDTLKRALTVEFYANNGQSVAKQSYLGNLTSIKGGGGAQKYRDESETHRCKGGNQKLATALAKKIGGDRLVLGLPVTRIVHDGKNVVVHCKDGRTIECDDVVLAVPPSVWSKIEIVPGLPAALAPQMGKNVKFYAPVKSRFWKEKGEEQYSLADGQVSMTWEGTDGQTGDGPFVMIAFSGAEAAEACLSKSAEERDKAYFEELEQLYPGFKEQVSGKSFFMGWPNEPWTKASYSFPAPGQITTQGPILRNGVGRLHFAGEHTCYKFVGYMEGALQSGAAVAKRIAMREGVINK